MDPGTKYKFATLGNGAITVTPQNTDYIYGTSGNGHYITLQGSAGNCCALVCIKLNTWILETYKGSITYQ